MITDINNEDRLVQQTFPAHLEQTLGWESVYANNTETFEFCTKLILITHEAQPMSQWGSQTGIA